MSEKKTVKTTTKNYLAGVNFVFVHTFAFIFAGFEANLKHQKTTSEIIDVLTAPGHLIQVIGWYIVLMVMTWFAGMFWSRGNENDHKRSYQFAAVLAIFVTLFYALNASRYFYFVSPDIIGLLKPYVSTFAYTSLGAVIAFMIEINRVKKNSEECY